MARLLWLAIGITVAGYADSAVYFYNGDLDGAEYLPVQIGGSVENARVYENFVVNGAGQKFSGIFGSFSMNFVPTHALIDIRLGTSQGQAGLSIYSSIRPVSVSLLSGSSSSGPHYRVRASVDLLMAPGHFHFALSPIGSQPSDISRIGTTSGVNASGYPTMDGSAFYYNPSSGMNYVPASTVVTNPNLSMGVEYLPFPEPASFTIIGLGVLWFKRKRK